jgi:hypothetical protein
MGSLDAITPLTSKPKEPFGIGRKPDHGILVCNEAA